MLRLALSLAIVTCAAGPVLAADKKNTANPMFNSYMDSAGNTYRSWGTGADQKTYRYQSPNEMTNPSLPLRDAAPAPSPGSRAPALPQPAGKTTSTTTGTRDSLNLPAPGSDIRLPSALSAPKSAPASSASAKPAPKKTN